MSLFCQIQQNLNKMSSNRSRSHSRSRSRNSTSDTSSSISSSKSEEVSQDILEKSRKSKHSEKKEKYDKKDKQDADDQRDDIVIVFDWNSYDSFCILILMFFGIFSRFWIIQYPRSFVGKEELQIQYINSYLNGSFFMDSEPPLSSLILAFTAHSLGYRQTIKPPYHNSNYTFQSMEYMSLRVPSALLSSFVVPISFVIVRLLGGSTFASLGAGFFTLFDFLLIGTARNCATDGFVQFSVALSVFFSALLRHFHPSSTSWSICIILQSFFAGISFSSHFLTRHNAVSHSILRRVRSLRPEKSPLLSCVCGAMCVPLHTQNGNGARPRRATPPPAIFFRKKTRRGVACPGKIPYLCSPPLRGARVGAH